MPEFETWPGRWARQRGRLGNRNRYEVFRSTFPPVPAPPYETSTLDVGIMFFGPSRRWRILHPIRWRRLRAHRQASAEAFARGVLLLPVPRGAP